MRIEVTGRALDLTDAISEYAERKCEKLLKYYDGVQEIEAVLDKEKEDFTAELIVHAVKHDPFIAKANHRDVYAAIDEASDKMRRQLNDFKSRLREHT